MKSEFGMNTILDSLAPSGWEPSEGSFEAFARYLPAMDFLLYVKEDCSYVEERIDGRLTLLWHPEDDRVVGIRIKGFRALYQALARILKAQEFDLVRELPFVSLVSALELAMLSGLGDAIIEDTERQRIEDGYKRAKVIAADAKVASKDLQGLLAA